MLVFRRVSYLYAREIKMPMAFGTENFVTLIFPGHIDEKNI